MTALQTDPTDTWKVCLPPSNVTLAAASLSGITKIILQGIDRNATNLGNFTAEVEFPAPAYNFHDLFIQNLSWGVNLWPNQYYENCDITSFSIDSGTDLGTVEGRNCSFGTITADSVTTVFNLINCTIGNTGSIGNNVFNSCKVSPGSTLDFNVDSKITDTLFGANCTVISAVQVSLDQVSEFSLLSQNGDLQGVLVSLSGLGTAVDLPNANAPSLDFTGHTRAILCASRITGNITKSIVATGGSTKQTFIIDSYNTTGFTYTIMFGVTPLAVIGNGNNRYVFQLDAAATTVSLLSVTKLG